MSPFQMTVAPDGNVWFTEGLANKIGRITPSGTGSEFPVPTAYSPGPLPGLIGITVGPDGNIWFAEYTNKKIGVLVY
jgi:streptogramin lyase